ncbi:hypothetical protein [Desulfonatronum parangueonense]
MPTTTISGLTHEASHPFLDTDTSRWISSEDFFLHARSPEASDADHQWIWLYRAPWMQVVAGGSDDEMSIAGLLDQWRHEQRTVLNLRPILGNRLVLINVDQVAVQEIRTKLGLALWQGDPAEETSLPPATATCAAKLFEWCRPRDWDLFEALEASAWHGEGKPCFRQDLQPPDDTAFTGILSVIQNGLGYSLLRDQLQKAEQDLELLQAERDAQVGKLSHAENEKRELAQENELLLAQLHQVQEELERSYLSQTEAKNEQDRQTQALAEKDAQIAKLTRERDNLSKDQKELQQKSAAEGKQIQELRKNAEEHQAQITKLTKERDAQVDKLSHAENEKRELAQENELLLAQLHQVQEELERYYLANQELIAGLDRSTLTMHRARAAISRKLSAQQPRQQRNGKVVVSL